MKPTADKFLHNHPMTEQKLGIDEHHVIVDKDDWKRARKAYATAVKSEPAEGAEEIAQRCPVCGGNGLVPNGFYNTVSGVGSTTSITPETCRTCNGTGFIMASFLHAQRLADKMVEEKMSETCQTCEDTNAKELHCRCCGNNFPI